MVLNGGLPWPGTNAGTPAAAVTPPVLSLTPVQGKPADYLNQLADRVAELPAEHDEGAYQYTKTWGWWLHTAADVPGGAANAAVPTITETWIDKRDSGRRLSTYGDPIFPDPKQEQAARDAGLVAGKKIDDDRYGAGKFPDAGQTWQGIEPFSHNPDQLAGQLKQVNWEGGMIIFGVSDMLHYAERSGPVDPKLRAAALRVLADTPGLKVSTATTWKGRHVVAVTQEKTWHGSTERNSIFFTPDTAYPVGSEEALFGNARQLNVRVPATLAVTETIERRPVTTVQERP
ncbi:hypothetical protein ACF063_05965 [Streptomyces chartreusis]|uniref:hypothetical protein n=1 Tax=Streptomyces chartreusis TaxID=1969 RepID=UPI003702B5F4